ncbi:hypothetical protein [Flavitalea sp.]|nr:hypothetical protein [Flavitalea sp.]
MSIQNSNLIQTKYSYDTVVAVTQKALNNAIETWYEDATTFSLVTYYFIKDSSGNPQAIDKASLLKLTNNIDPLSATLTSAQQKTLSTTVFYFAFSFIIGNPANALNINYITLSPGTDTVQYDLLCRTLQVAFWNPDNQSWISIKQTTAREFNISADINLKNVLDNSNLPPRVQAAVDTLGGTDVNVQQLLFDLDSAVVAPTTTVAGLSSSCSVFKPLMQQFANAYFSTYTAQSGALNYALTTSNTASLAPTKMDWYINAFVDSKGNLISNPTEDQQDLATLSYLFANNSDKLNPSAQLNWNWLEDNGSSHNPDMDTNADVNKYDGAISVKRDAFANYLISQLNGYVQQNCWAPYIDQTPETYGDLVFTLGTPPSNVFSAYNPNSMADGEPDQLFLYFYDKIFTLPVVQVIPAATMNVTCFFDLQVYLGDGSTAPVNRLTLQQSFHIQISTTLTDPTTGKAKVYSGSPVNKSFTDVFNVQVDDHGNIVFVKNSALSTSTDISTDVNLPFENDWDSTDSYVQNLAAKTFSEIPFTFPQQFVFPGGNAFTFQDAQFSGFSDLVCHFTYKAES